MLTPEQTTAISELSELLMTKKEIETITGITRNTQGFSEAYQKGLLLRKSRIHKAILDLAEAGSAPAQSMARDIMKKNSYA
jgi:hypothetical protein